MVGAGGIGCELLKTLVLSGFENIEMIDLDTIDVSNLNRQFLFRRKHVGQSKALVARESALKFRPGGEKTITAHHGNVKDETFDFMFVKRFDVVLNGLDNLEGAQARQPAVPRGGDAFGGERHHRIPRAGHRSRGQGHRRVFRVLSQADTQVAPHMHPA